MTNPTWPLLPRHCGQNWQFDGIASPAAPAETVQVDTSGVRAWRNGRRSRLQLECPRGNPRCRTAQSRGTLPGAMPRSQSRAKPPQPAEGVETGRAAPKASVKRRRRDSPDHERRAQPRRRRKPKWYENLLSPGEVRVRAPPPAPAHETNRPEGARHPPARRAEIREAGLCPDPPGAKPLDLQYMKINWFPKAFGRRAKPRSGLWWLWAEPRPPLS